MVFDNSTANQKIDGRLLRLATREFAHTNYGNLVVNILLGKALVTVQNSINGKDIVIIRVPGRREFDLTILKEDFDICKNIANTQLEPRLFPSDKLEDLVKRATGMVDELFRYRP